MTFEINRLNELQYIKYESRGVFVFFKKTLKLLLTHSLIFKKLNK